MDWNQDGDFNDPGELVFSSTAYASSQTGAFHIPDTAMLGTTRMRIGISYTPSSGPADPCATTNNGEYEDYSLIVLSPCTNPVVNLGNDTSICEGTSLVLDADNAGLSYLWNDSTTNQTITITSAGTYFVKVTDGMCSTTDSIIISLDSLPSGSGIAILDNGNGSFDFSVAGAIAINQYQWSFGDGAIGTGANVTHQYTQTGTYAVNVIISNDCGTDTLTASVDAYVVGIKNIDPNGNLLNLYPNPTKDKIVFESKNDLKMQGLKIYNILGQLVFEDKASNLNKYQLNVSKWVSGIYTVQIKTNNGTIIRKFEILK